MQRVAKRDVKYVGMRNQQFINTNASTSQRHEYSACYNVMSLLIIFLVMVKNTVSLPPNKWEKNVIQETNFLYSSRKSGAGLRIALHCQAKFAEHGWVAGSEITTAGLKRAFESFSGVEHVEVFAPFSYNNLIENGPWDFVLVEGYSGSVPEFIKTIRSEYEKRKYMSNNQDAVVPPPPPIIAHFCLDTYPSLNLIVKLDVDMFFTNSHSMRDTLNRYAPTYFFELAADPGIMKPMSNKHPIYSKHNVVYLGHNSATKEHLYNMLREAIPYGLTIYGHNWASDENTDLVKHWRGVLPKDDIGLLYSNAKVVIGVTEDKQKMRGMINNRVFEVLSTGAPLISDHFDRLEEKFGNDLIMFYKKKGDMKFWLDRILHNETLRLELKQFGRQRILDKETWTHRATDMLRRFAAARNNVVRKVQSDNSFSNSTLWRSNRPRACLLYQKDVTGGDKGNIFLTNFILPELLYVERSYRIDLLPFHNDNGCHMTKSRNSKLLQKLDLYDIILIYDGVNGIIETNIRMLRRTYNVVPGENGFRDNTGIHGRKILLIKPASLDGDKVIKIKKYAVEFYDAIILPSTKHVLKIDDTIDDDDDNDNLNAYYYGNKRIFGLPFDPMKTKISDSFPCKLNEKSNLVGPRLFDTIFNNIYLRTRHSARAYFQTPRNGEIIYISPRMTTVNVIIGVVLENFIPPRDGMWCLRIDDEEVFCNGDEKFNAVSTIEVPLNAKEKQVIFTLILRNHIQRHVVFDGSTNNYNNKHRDKGNLKTNRIRIKIIRTTHERVEYVNLKKIHYQKKKPKLIRSYFDQDAGAVMYKVNRLPSDFSRVYCKFIFPRIPSPNYNSNENGLVAGTVEGADMEPLMDVSSESKCSNSCYVSIHPAIPLPSIHYDEKENGEWYCYLPMTHHDTSIIAESYIVFKTIEREKILDFNKLYGISGQDILLKQYESCDGKVENNVAEHQNNQILYFSNDCDIHQGNIIGKDRNRISFMQLYHARCLNNSVASHSILPPYVVLWNYNFKSLSSLKGESFISVTIKIDVAITAMNPSELKVLFAECKRLLQHNGTLRFVLLSSTNRAFNEILIEIMETHGFTVVKSISPVTTIAIVPNFEVNNYFYNDGFFPSTMIVEGYLGMKEETLMTTKAYKIL